MELRQLEYFVTVCEFRNFTRAAEVLGVSQPSVTKAIKTLERELNLVLIDRSQKRAALTEEGAAFLVHARRILQDVEAAKEDMHRFHVGAKGIVHFGLPPMIEAYLFPNLFLDFEKKYPEISLEMQECVDSMQVEEKVTRGELDFGILLRAPGHCAHNELALLRSPLSLCVSAQHPLAGRKNAEIRALEDEKFILEPPGTYQYDSVVTRCEEAGFAPSILLTTSQMKTAKQLVARGAGISILPDFVTSTEKNMVRVPLAEPLVVEIVLQWNEHIEKTAAIDYFMQFMRSYAHVHHQL